MALTLPMQGYGVSYSKLKENTMTIAEAYIIDNLFGDMNELQLITIRDRKGKLVHKDMHRLIKRSKEKIYEHTKKN
jgi:DNA-binding transcriptional regulator YhcF (GntR family)